MDAWVGSCVFYGEGCTGLWKQMAGEGQTGYLRSCMGGHRTCKLLQGTQTNTASGWGHIRREAVRLNAAWYILYILYNIITADPNKFKIQNAKNALIHS